MSREGEGREKLFIKAKEHNDPTPARKTSNNANHFQFFLLAAKKKGEKRQEIIEYEYTGRRREGSSALGSADSQRSPGSWPPLLGF